MYTLTKIVGLIFLVFGLIVLMSCFDSIDKDLLDTITLGFFGLIFMVVGVIALIWDVPIDKGDY